MSFNNGDIVRIGKGKVEYTVRFDGESLNLIGAKSSRKNVDPATLTLVHSDFLSDAEIETEIAEQPDTRDDGTSLDLTPADGLARQYPMPTWEVELSDAANDTKRPFLLTVDHVITAHKSYGAACDALIIAARAGFEHYAVIDQGGKRLATRTAA